MTPLSIAEVRLKAQSLMSKTRRDLFVRSAFAVIAAIFCGIVFWKSSSAVGWISGIVMLMLLANTARSVHLQRWKSRQLSPDISSNAARTPCLEFYRSELERQRDLASNVWTWYLGPFIPGLLLSMIASMLHETHLRHLSAVAFWYAVMAAFFIFVWRLNARAARCLQRMLDELGAVESSQ